MSKTTYVARPGVDWVNGQRVPKNREIVLTAAEAKFDLAQGRIHPKADAKPAASSKAKADKPESKD
ncbi:hypothetical protein [Pararhizobium haloflavum]|uniref:hypothetical protein n=1 Tax=Pararhizobium haloflavum TaxID=2037914 RepID=UPI0012FFE2F6|nr:hypothetical protein [Pararhizobium haloflavum]